MKEYLVCVHQKMDEEGKYTNLAKYMKGLRYSCYTNLEEAKMDLKKFIERNNRGARTETYYLGDIGIDMVVDAEAADSLAVTDWYIKVREVTPWEMFERM